MKKSISLERMTDVCAGKIRLKDIDREIMHYMALYAPLNKIVVEITRSKKHEGYYTTIYIPIKDFERKK